MRQGTPFDVAPPPPELPVDEHRGGRPADRFRTPESYVHWDRGLAIVAGMIAIVLIFFLLFVLLPINEDDSGGTVTGQAAPPAAATPAAPAAQQQQAPAAPATGPETPRLPATARQFPFVRKGPGINFAVIMNLQQGQRVDVVGRSTDRQWVQIILPENNRERGWVSLDLLDVSGDLNALPEVRE